MNFPRFCLALLGFGNVKLQPWRRLGIITIMVMLLLFGLLVYGVADYFPALWRVVAAVVAAGAPFAVLLWELNKSLDNGRRPRR